MPRICVIGSANVDHTLALPRLPRPGETVSGGTLLTNLGGKGANQAVAARKLGAELRMLGAVGEDGPGREIRERLDAAGIDVTGIVAVPDAATGTALIFVDAEGRNQIGVAPGANHCLTVEMLRPYEGAIAWADIVVCQLETPLPVVRWALEEAHRHGVRAILNPAPVRELPDDLLGLVAYLTPNAGEAAALAGITIGDMDSAREAGRRLLERAAIERCAAGTSVPGRRRSNASGMSAATTTIRSSAASTSSRAPRFRFSACTRANWNWGRPAGG